MFKFVKFATAQDPFRKYLIDVFSDQISYMNIGQRMEMRL